MNADYFLDLIRDHANGSARSQQLEIGWSQAGGVACQTWRTLHSSPVTNPTTRVMAAVRGTALHSYLEPVLQADGWRTEIPVEYGGIAGHVDAFKDGTVLDLKTAGSREKVQALRAYGPSDAYRVQVHGYGAGLAALGHEVHTVGILMVAVDTSDEVALWTEPWDEQIARDGVMTVEYLASFDKPYPPLKPWTWCRDWCKFYDESGEVGCTGLRRELPEIDDEQARQAARTVADLGRVADDIKAAKAALEGWQGTVGELTVTTVHRRGKPSPDMDAIKALFGDDVPTKPGRDSTYVVVR